MGLLEQWVANQGRDRERLQAMAPDAAVLLDQLASSLSLELGRLAGAQLTLVEFTDSALTLLAEFLPIAGMEFTIAADSVPCVERRIGTIEAAAGEPATRARAELPVGADSRLTLIGVPGLLVESDILERVCEDLARATDRVVGEERARRRRATHEVDNRIAALRDIRDAAQLENIARAFSLLPHLLGMSIEVRTAGAICTARAGRSGDGEGAAFERVVILENGTIVRCTATRERIAADDTATTSDGNAADEKLVSLIDALGDRVAAVLAAQQDRDSKDRDAFTGLGDRRFIVRELAGALRRCERTAEPVSVAVIALDWQRRTDDPLLRALARTIAQISAETGNEPTGGVSIGRVSDDRLVLVAEGKDHLALGEQLERARAVFNSGAGAGLTARPPSCSAGLVCAPVDGEEPDELLRRAHALADEARARGGNAVWTSAAHSGVR